MLFFFFSQPCKGAPTVRTTFLNQCCILYFKHTKNVVLTLKGDSSQALTIDTSSSIKVKGLTIQNSQQMHFTISRCDSVRILGVKVASPGDSPNTDGIHISESTNVIVQDCKIGTGSELNQHVYD